MHTILKPFQKQITLFANLFLLVLSLGFFFACAGVPEYPINENWSYDTEVHATIQGTRVSFDVRQENHEGYKILWSMAQNPSLDGGDEVHSLFRAPGDRKTADLWGFDGMGQYYIRIVSLKGGEALSYSNQVSAYLPASGPTE